MFVKPITGLISGVLVTLCASSSIHAQGSSVGNCFFQNGGKNIIIMPGSTSLIPVMKYLGAQLSKMSNKHLLVYFPMASCDAMKRINTLEFIKGTGEFYEENKADPTKIDTSSCTIDGSVPLDLAVGDTFFETCDMEGARVPSLGDFQGPQQAFVFVTPRSNQQVSSVTAAEARVIYSCGARGNVSPFREDNFIFGYSSGKFLYGAQLIIEKALNMRQFDSGLGTVARAYESDYELARAVAASTVPDKTLGYVSAEVYDEFRGQLKSLSFRAFNQTLAYLPDSNSNSRDKRNVRDGHYTVQAPVHLWAALNTDGSFQRPLAKKMVDWMQGNPVAPEDGLPVSINEVYAKAGVVPKCAMKVKRNVDGGPFIPYVPEVAPCGCSFEVAATGQTTPPGCVACMDKGGCASGQVCSFGFCEMAW